jgi:NMD protein affecting ribosome stability and mRNA decay
MTKGRYARQDKMIKEKRHDVYRDREKLPEPTLCTDCGALFTGGRWTWKETEAEANKATCPACRRIADRLPAGTIEMRGEFFDSNRDEIINLVRNIEKQQKGEHPLERIMEITDSRGRTVVTTTGIHVARRIGEALSRSYKGEFSFQYGDGEKTLRAFWAR